MSSSLFSDYARNLPIAVWTTHTASDEARGEKKVKVQIIETQTFADEGNNCKKMHYVHQIGVNRRHDQWVSDSEIEILLNLSNTSSLTSPNFSQHSFTNHSEIVLESLDMLAENDKDNEALSKGSTNLLNVRTRKQKKKNDIFLNSETSLWDLDPALRALEADYRKKTEMKFIEYVQFGQYLFRTWYFSQFPAQGGYKTAKKIYVCPYCMKYMLDPRTYFEHTYNQQCGMHGILPGR
ncbi:MAG: K(lysine) acetyltransferase, partial [Marteilia pararefringens]